MTPVQYAEHMRWVASRMPKIYETLSDPEFAGGWFDDFFQHLDDVDVEVGRLAMVKEEIIPNAERFMSRWYHFAKKAETKRTERMARAQEASRNRKAVREVLTDGHCGRIYRECLKQPKGDRVEYVRNCFKELDEKGINY